MDYPVEGGQVISWDDELDYGSVNRPRLSVSVKSGSEISQDAQHRITPAIQDEMERFLESGTATIVTQGLEPVSLTINNISAQTFLPVNTALVKQGSAPEPIKSSQQGNISVLGPFVKREVTVETDYDIETSNPEPLPVRDNGLIFTKKKTLKTTTKQVTTTVKQVRLKSLHSIIMLL